MKNRFYGTVLCLMMLGSLRPARAADGAAAWTDKDQAKFQERLDKRTRKRLRTISHQLNLTPEQVAAVQKILDDRNAQMLAQENDYRQKRAALRNETQQKFLQEFTPEQRDLYENGEGQRGGTRLHDQQPARYHGGGLDED